MAAADPDIVVETWRYERPIARRGQSTAALRLGHDWPRVAAAIVVVCAHAGLLLLNPIRLRDVSRSFDVRPLLVEFLEESAPANLPAPLPSVQIREPVVALPDLALLDIDVPAESRTPVRGVAKLPFRAPLPGSPLPDSSAFAEQAGLARGASATVVLAVDVSASGVVTSVMVERSSGDPRVDAAAAAYAESLRWSPGITNGEPRAMRVRFTATLRRRFA